MAASGGRVERGRRERTERKLLQVMDLSIIFGFHRFYRCVTSKLIKLYTLNLCNLLDVNYTSIKPFLQVSVYKETY